MRLSVLITDLIIDVEILCMPMTADLQLYLPRREKFTALEIFTIGATSVHQLLMIYRFQSCHPHQKTLLAGTH